METKIKNHQHLLNELDLIDIDTELGGEVVGVATNYMSDLWDELEEKYNGDREKIQEEWSYGWQYATDEAFKKLNTLIQQCKIKSITDFIKNCTNYNNAIPKDENDIKDLFNKIVVNSVFHYHYA